MKVKLRHILTRKELTLIVLLTSFLTVSAVMIFYTPNHYTVSAPVHFEIKRGTSVNEIIDDLYIADVIPNRFLMKLAVLISGANRKLQAGEYDIPNDLSYLGLIELLSSGNGAFQKKVTIQEGIWQFKLAGLLQRELGLDSVKIMRLSKDKAFLNSLLINANSIEGYLLPETYYFNSNVTEKEALKKLKNHMDKLFDENARIQMALLGMTKHQILTMASIIDGESNRVSEFKRIAGVYYNRLRKGIKLQADPTVQYLIREKKRHNKIYFKDLEIDSPYNTYKFKGLPPGPINNPGKDAVLAALYPEENDFLFFVASGDGGHRFAKTKSEHQRNVAKYRRWRSNNRKR
ncbi:MAG: endolytic transglycosylase MltG [Chlorobi bacterium]|nr:endolytic transglycosylase MltG [Chlorobiota bacterium]